MRLDRALRRALLAATTEEHVPGTPGTTSCSNLKSFSNKSNNTHIHCTKTPAGRKSGATRLCIVNSHEVSSARILGLSSERAEERVGLLATVRARTCVRVCVCIAACLHMQPICARQRHVSAARSVAIRIARRIRGRLFSLVENFAGEFDCQPRRRRDNHRGFSSPHFY